MPIARGRTRAGLGPVSPQPRLGHPSSRATIRAIWRSRAFVRRADTLAPQDRIALHFALGEARTTFGEHEQAFAHFIEGNALQRARTHYDEASVFAQFDTLRATVTHDYLAARHGGGDPSDSPVFIVGMPRSGSTLIQQVLASHPDVYGAGEYPAFATAPRRLCFASPCGAARRDLAARDDVRRLRRNRPRLSARN